MNWLDQDMAIGPDVRAKVIKRIVRCAATNVDPATGVRDLSIPETLMRAYGHQDCGIYLDIIAGGMISAGDHVDLAPAS